MLYNFLFGLSGGSGSFSSLYYNTVVADTPVNYWRLGESSGTTVTDSILTQDLIYFNVTLNQTSIVDSTNDSCVYFNGTTSYIYKFISNYRNIDTQGTIECWFKTDATGGNIFASVDSGTGNNRLQITVRDSATNGNILIGNRVSGTWSIKETSGTNYADNQVHHLVVSSNGSTYKMFVDGSEVSLSFTSGSNDGYWFDDIGSTDIVLIGQTWNGLSPFEGYIDEVAIYDYQLSTTKVVEHYFAGLDTTYDDYISALIPVSYWKFDEVSGTTAYDDTGTNNATYVNTTSLSQTSIVADGKYSVSLNGTDEYIEISSGIRPTTNAALTILVWLNLDTAPIHPIRSAIMALQPQGAHSDGRGCILRISDSEIRFQYGGGSGWTTFAISTTINSSTTYCIAIVYEGTGSSIYMYLNGTQIGSASATNLEFGDRTGEAAFWGIGAEVTSASSAIKENFLDGYIDNVAIFDGALTPTEISNIYSNGS